MKKLLFIALFVFCALSCFAQADIYTLSTDVRALKRMYGKPIEEDHGYHFMCADVLIYPHFEIYLERVSSNGVEGRCLDGFATDIDKFCFLSKLYAGGIKVGTKLSDLEKFDFAGSRYGRAYENNGLRALKAEEGVYKVFKKNATHILFEKSYRFYYFTVEDGVITEWAMSSKEDFPLDPTKTKLDPKLVY